MLSIPDPLALSKLTRDWVDLDNSVIVDVETTAPIRQAEVTAALDMVDRVEEKFGIYPERFVGDGAYDNAETFGWLVHEKGIEPHVPVLDKSQREDLTFSRADFKFDHRNDRHLCPAGKELLPAPGNSKPSVPM